MVKIAIIAFAIVCIVLGLIDSTSQLVATINPSEACEKEFGHCGRDGSHYILND